MSTFNPHRNNAALYDAAQVWAQRSLVSSNSVLSDASALWSLENFKELDRRFVKNLDEGSGSFVEKLRDQLAGGTPQCQQLMAELAWVMALFPSNNGPESKRKSVTEIWSWSGSSLPADHELLSDAVLIGIGSAGTAYNTHKWREVAFAITAFQNLRSLSEAEQSRIASDPWLFVEWLQGQPGADNRQLLHILPHLGSGLIVAARR